MFVRMKESLGTPYAPDGVFFAGTVYDVPDAIGADVVRKGLGTVSPTPPQHIVEFLARLDEGAGRPCLFLPFVGEFGHLIMSHVRLVHWHKASEKIVCCRRGEEVLFPTASAFITNWVDPIPDLERVGTHRTNPPQWPDLLRVAQTMGCHPIQVGGLSLAQELHPIEPEQRIEFRPLLRGLRADVVIGTRKREFAPEKNWQHWQRVADALEDASLTFAVIGEKSTSEDLTGQECHTGDLDTDAAIELLQNCRLYIGTDSGGSHLASTVGCPMLVFREPRNGMRDFVPRMQLVNPGRVEHLADGWDEPDAVIARALAILSGAEMDVPELPSPHYVAQHGEDRWMARNWKRLGLPNRGTFVEVGAGNGKYLSNTYWLEKVKGWTGLLVEPDPRQRDALAENRPDAIVHHGAAGRICRVANFGLMDLPELSGLRRDDAAQHIDVPVDSLSLILARHGVDHVDVLSIDTEGTEVDVFESLDLTRWRPRLVIIEWNTDGLPSNRDAIMARLTADGYRIAAELGGNLLFTDATAEVEITSARTPAGFRDFVPAGTGAR